MTVHVLIQIFCTTNEWILSTLGVCKWVWSYLKACDSEPAGLVWQCSNRNDEWAVRDMLVVKLDRHLIVTWGSRQGIYFHHQMNWTKYGRITEEFGSFKTRKKHSNEGQSTLVGQKLYLVLSLCRRRRRNHPSCPQRRFQPCWGPLQQWTDRQHLPLWSKY